MNIFDGWGGEVNTQYSNNGMVRIMAWLDDSTADYKSGWFTFNSQNGSASFKELSHSLGIVPGRIKVLVKANTPSKPNYNYIFHGIGSSQMDATSGFNYGGVVFGYNSTNVSFSSFFFYSTFPSFFFSL